MNNGKPLYIYSPYSDKPWFWVESDPKTHPCALPYYLAVEFGDYVRFPEPHCNAHEDAGTEWPDMYTKEQMLDFAKAYLAQYHAVKKSEE